MDADGSDQTNITDNPRNSTSIPPGPRTAARSPSTRSATETTRGEIYVMDADGSGQTNLTEHEAERHVSRLVDDP